MGLNIGIILVFIFSSTLVHSKFMSMRQLLTLLTGGPMLQPQIEICRTLSKLFFLRTERQRMPRVKEQRQRAARLLCLSLAFSTTVAVARSRHAADLQLFTGGLLLPDPTLTPGAIDPNITLSNICNGTTKSRRHVTAATRAEVMREYNQPSITTDDYELDHLIPLALGGNNSAANLWPQPAPDYHLKDELEVEMQSRACSAYRTMQPTSAAEVLRQEQHEIAEDWTAAAKSYLHR